MKTVHLKLVNAARLERRPVAIVKDLGNGSDRVLFSDELFSDELGGAISGLLKNGKAGIVEVGEKRVFLNIYLPPPEIVIVGAVHITQALAPMAKLAEFDVRIIAVHEMKRNSCGWSW